MCEWTFAIHVEESQSESNPSAVPSVTALIHWEHLTRAFSIARGSSTKESWNTKPSWVFDSFCLLFHGAQMAFPYVYSWKTSCEWLAWETLAMLGSQTLTPVHFPCWKQVWKKITFKKHFHSLKNWTHTDTRSHTDTRTHGLCKVSLIASPPPWMLISSYLESLWSVPRLAMQLFSRLRHSCRILEDFTRFLQVLAETLSRSRS